MNPLSITSWYSLDDAGYSLTKTIEVKRGQSCNLIDFIDTPVTTQQAHITFLVHGGGSLYFTLVLGAATILEYSITVILAQEDAYAKITGVGFLCDTQSANIISMQKHEKPDTSSTLVFKSVLDDKSSFTYSGTIQIQENAQRSHAKQYAKQLLLSPTAKAIAIPALEVHAHQVQCAHGTATSQLDQEALWYAHAKGIDYQTAKKLILESFLSEELAHCNPDLKNSILHYLLLKKGNMC